MTDYIDPHSKHSLYDLIAGDVPPGESTEYMGFHLVSHGETSFIAQLDGHLGSIERFDADDYDDVLELVDDLNGLVVRYNEFTYQDDREELVEWAGKMMTSDEEKAENEPELWTYVPQEPPTA